MEENKDIEALMGTTTANQANSTDWKQKYEDAERRLQSASVEQGRVKKLNSELEDARKRIEELESVKGREEMISSLTQEERERIPNEVLEVATKLVANGMGRVQEDTERRLRELEERRGADETARREENSRRFVERIDMRFPGFRKSVLDGGDKASEWANYLRFNKSSISAAFNSGDFDTFAYHVEMFYRNHLGIPLPSSDTQAAVEPTTSGSGAHGGDKLTTGKTYTSEEFLKLYDDLESARDRGDTEAVKRINSEIKSAPAEGRVK